MKILLVLKEDATFTQFLFKLFTVYLKKERKKLEKILELIIVNAVISFAILKMM